MRYVIVGAGAVGGAIGGWLAHLGHNVLFVARGAHGEAIARRGLTVSGPDSEFTVRSEVVGSVLEWVPRPGDALVLAVKSQDTAALLAQLAPRVGKDPSLAAALPVFCCQNGLNNEREVLRFFPHVHGVAVALPSMRAAPGQVVTYGSPLAGTLEVGSFPHGSDPRDGQLAADLGAAGFLATVQEDVMSWKAAKLLLMNLKNALEVLCGPAALAADAASTDALTAALRAEAANTFAAAGIATADLRDAAARIHDHLTVMPVNGQARPGGSTWQSLSHQDAALETDYLNGEIVLLGRLHGVATPVNEYLQAAASQYMSASPRVTQTPAQLCARLGLTA